MINIVDLHKSFGSKVLFDGLNLSMAPRERLGLVGRNGNGKTTLFKMILGQMQYDSGSIVKPKNYHIGYLQQHINFSEKKLLDEVCLALSGEEKYDAWKAEKILFGLGFGQEDMERSPEEFSGGYKIRINLAKVLLSKADMLLLDEPNNYLDIVAIRWLENFLRQWDGELILITHDRNFIDSIVTSCASIHRNKIRKVEGNTEKLYEQINREEEIYEKTRQNVEKKTQQTELFIRRFRAKARLASMVQSRIKTLSKQAPMEKLASLQDLDFSFSSKSFAASKMMGVHNLSFGYQKDLPLIQDLSFDVLKRERICIVGKNGKGKSTLLKLLANRLKADSGSIKTHPDLCSAYFVQSDSAKLNPQKTLLEEIQGALPEAKANLARTLAGQMMFSGDDALKKISVLSGGEKSRVLLAKILASPCHLLLLDEPTNHLDIQSCESLIDAIDNFDGSVIMVTHNEELLHKIAQKLIVFDRGKTIFFDGTYQDFLDTKGWQDEGLQLKLKGAKGKKVLSADEKKKARALLIQEKSKALKNCMQEISRLEKEIETGEKTIAQNNENLITKTSCKDFVGVAALAKENKEISLKLEQLYGELASKNSALDEITEKFEERLRELY